MAERHYIPVRVNDTHDGMLLVWKEPGRIRFELIVGGMPGGVVCFSTTPDFAGGLTNRLLDLTQESDE